MHTYISSTMGFRNKGSFYFNDLYCLNERTECPYSCGGPLSIHGFSVNPRILYGLRQSTLIQWSASRRLILGRNYGNGYCRLAAAAAACNRERGFQVIHPLKERRRERRIACMVWENDGFDSCSNGSVEEMLSLMTDVIGRDPRERSGRLPAKSSTKTGVQRCCVCEKEKEVRVDDSSRREEKYVESSSWGRKSKGEIKIQPEEGYRLSRREDSLRDDSHKVRKGRSSSSYYSALSSGDFESNVDERIRVKQGKAVGSSLSGDTNHTRRVRMGICGEDIKQIQEYSDDRRLVESSTERNAARESMKQYDRLRPDVMESDTEWGSIKESEKFTEISKSQESDIQRASTSENRSKMRMEDGEEYRDDRCYVESSTKRIAPGESMAQDDRLRSDVMESDIERGSIKVLEKDTGISWSRDSGIQRASSSENLSKMKIEDGEHISISSVNLVRGEREQVTHKDQRVTRQKESRKESRTLNRISDFREDDIERISNSQEQFNTRIQYREEDTRSDMNLIGEERMQHRRTDQQVIGQTGSRKKSQNLTEVSEIHDIDIERASSSQRVYKTRMTDREENSALVLNSVQEVRQQGTRTDQQAVRQTQLRKESQELNISGSHSSGTERSSSSNRVSETRINDQEESLTSLMNLVQEDRTQQYQTDEQVIRQRGSRKQSYTNISETHESNIERASSSSQMLQKMRTKDQVESSSSGLYSAHGARRRPMGMQIEENRNSLVMVTPPQSQLVSRVSVKEAFNESMVGSSSSSHAHQQGKIPASLHELDDRTRRDDISDDALGSVDRLERSSAQFVGEFVDKLQQEASASQKLSLISKHTSEIQKDSRRLSAKSGTKGPSDEMWDVAGPSSQEPSVAEAPEKGSSAALPVELAALTSAGNTVVRRSSRSFWSYIADIVRKGWGARTESHTSPVKSGVQSSSNESLNSEAYFSGHEPDNDDDENVKKGRKGMPKEPSLAKDSSGQPSQRTGLTQIQEASEAMSSQDKITHVKADASTSTGILQRRPALRGAASASGKGDRQIELEKGKQHIPSSVGALDSSSPLVGHPSSSTGHLQAVTDKGEILETGIVEGSGFMEVEEGPTRERITKASRTEGIEEEPKQRKLQRNKQVLRERFDEWEEAFKLEHEQRKTDEMFMREALLEAKKAADTWEVPVGAVLVQNGKIIARGCNLVEELRDSTAHAEMICIRGASNLLRTWRLAPFSWRRRRKKRSNPPIPSKDDDPAWDPSN
ncbi:tRNA(adenine(34)) deaminase, chloroplastic isoform X2 [Magnolia sinica]|uniref:tRNA(adenine(34)) deaminase, chloroplastic isoform X2 n=1 Tax=Magnolia sinica TaxID=86752 RepID=UPI00265A2C6F|nr:tRNA(adenine(34)) deaminase, chloroplastic isoform X2 [Magnolia sinica]